MWAEKKGGGKLEKVTLENKYEKIKYKLLLVGIIIVIGTLFGAKFFVDNTPLEQKVYSLSTFPITEKVDLNILGLGTTTVAEKILSAEKETDLYIGDIVIFKILEPIVGSSSPKAISTEDFTILWANNIPPNLLSSVSSGSYIVGKCASETVNTFVVYELLNSEENISALKNWEENIATDTQNLFVGQEEPVINIFEDVVIGEKQSVRILKNNEDKVVIVYGFVDESLLIISDSIDIFMKLIEGVPQENAAI